MMLVKNVAFDTSWLALSLAMPNANVKFEGFCVRKK